MPRVENATQVAISYLLRSIGLGPSQIDQENNEFFGQVMPPCRNFFIAGSKRVKELTATGEPIHKALATLGIDAEILRIARIKVLSENPLAERKPELFQKLMNQEAERLAKMVHGAIDKALSNVNPEFVAFCNLVSIYNKQFKHGNETIGGNLIENYFLNNYGLNITSLLDPNAKMAQDERRGGFVPIRINHDSEHFWSARYLGELQNDPNRNFTDMGRLTHAFAVCSYVSKKNSAEDKGTWNGSLTRVCSLNRVNHDETGPVVTVNTCTTDYISLLATHYGLLKEEAWTREKVNQANLQEKAGQLAMNIAEKQAILQSDGTLDIAIQAMADLHQMAEWDEERIIKVLDEISEQTSKEHKLPVININESVLANSLSVNVVYRKGSYVYIQIRGNAGHGRVQYQASAAGFMGLPASYKTPQDQTPYILSAIRSETQEEMGMEYDVFVSPGTMRLTGLVRDRYNCEVGVLATAEINEEMLTYNGAGEEVPDNDIVKITIETGAETKGFIKVPFMPLNVFLFVLRKASNRNGIFEPWNDFMPLGASALLFALIAEYGEQQVKTAWKEAQSIYEKENRVTRKLQDR